MNPGSRVAKTFLNARMNMLCYMASLFLAFFTRKIFLDKLGTEFIGLTETLLSLLGFLNLAELGVGSAIAYALYKPLFDKDESKINEIISLFGWLYRYIGLIIFFCGVLLSLFLPLIFSKTSINIVIIYIGFYSYLISSLLGYFVNYRATLLSADQRNYIVTGYFQAATISKTILQMLFAIYITNFYIFFSIEIIFSVICSVILNWKIRKTYPWLKISNSSGKELLKKYPEIVIYVKQIFFHQVGSFVQFQIAPIFINSMVSLSAVAIYGNYTCLTTRLKTCTNGILNSAAAGIGNLISEGNFEKIYKVYLELFAIRIFTAGILSCCFYYLCNPFIIIWLGNSYLLSPLEVLLISIQLFLILNRGVIDQFLYGYGVFYDIWAPLAETVIFAAIAVSCGYFWGLSGILCAGIISTVIMVYGWKPYLLYCKCFNMKYYRYFILLLNHFIPVVVCFVISSYLITFIYSKHILSSAWFYWLYGAFIFTILMILLLSAVYWVISSGFKAFSYRMLNIIRQKYCRKHSV